MYRGYVKTWRKVLDGGWLKNHKLWAFWSWCLLKASHKEIGIVVGLQKVQLMPGEFIFGRKAAALELGMSERNIRTCIHVLCKMKNTTIKTTNKFSIVSIINWDIYQGDEIVNDQQSDQQVTSKRPASDHKQECKNVKNDKKIFIIPSFEEIRAYCFERRNQVSVEQFFNYYESNGWLVGKNKMKDWKAAVRTWENSNYGGNNRNYKGRMGNDTPGSRIPEWKDETPQRTDSDERAARQALARINKQLGSH